MSSPSERPFKSVRHGSVVGGMMTSSGRIGEILQGFFCEFVLFSDSWKIIGNGGDMFFLALCFDDLR